MAVARHLVALSILDNGLTTDPAEAERMTDHPPESLRGAQAEFKRQCEDEPWSPERRACLFKATDQEETLRCPEQ